MRRARTLESIAISKIEGAIREIKFGTPPADTKAGYFLNKLSEVNKGMYEDLVLKYKVAVSNSNASSKDKMRILA